MLELDTMTFSWPIKLEQEIFGKFNFPIIFYQMHKKDNRAFFPTFVIIDFEREVLTYIISYSRENVSRVERDKNSELFKIVSYSCNPHCTIQEKKEESFFTFVENTRYFYHVNYKKNVVRIYTGEDLGISDEKERLVEFGSTLYKDDKDENFFYLTALIQNKATEVKSLNFYKVSLDLSKIDKIYSMQVSIGFAPHVTRKFDNFLINSEFLRREFKNNATGEIFIGANLYLNYVYYDLYKQYCTQKRKVCLESDFIEKNKILAGNIKLEPGFFDFCQSRGKNFLEICQRDKKYAFSSMPGTIMLLNLKTREKFYYNTTYCSPAHFEIDEQTGTIYTSSHNFTVLDRMYFLGPAAIDRFVLSDGGLKKTGTFMHPGAYRFTTHKLFYYQNNPYICSFGQPNRLFFINAKTMEVIYHDDIEDDVLSSQTDILGFVNRVDLEPITLKTIEVSPDGQYLFLLSYKYIYFYSFPDKRIVQRIEYHKDFMLNEEISLRDFYKRTTHADYLK